MLYWVSGGVVNVSSYAISPGMAMQCVTLLLPASARISGQAGGRAGASCIMLRVTPSRMSSHGGTNTHRRTVLPRQVYMCIYVFSYYCVRRIGLTGSSLDTIMPMRCSVSAVIVLRGRESITRQWAITHLRHTVLGSASVQESNDKGDADKRGFPCGDIAICI
jgi:hypothetical protein